jgi:YegS/Rv2252/BmrU family lipid kinase
MERRIALIINPVSGGAGKLDLARLEGIATEHASALDVLRTERSGHATGLAREAREEGFDLVLAGGGDGTVNEAINGLALSATPLGIVPLGTVNVLARECGLPLDPENAFRIALEREPRKITLGHIKTGEVERYFSFVAGAGLDAHVVHGVSTGLKKLIGKGAYIVKAISTLALWRPPRLVVSVEGREIDCQLVVASNGKDYGGDFVMAPDADITEPGLCFTLLTDMRAVAMLKFALAFGIGRHLSIKGVETIAAPGARISGKAHVQLDGDYFSTTPAEISSVTDALRLVF